MRGGGEGRRSIWRISEGGGLEREVVGGVEETSKGKLVVKCLTPSQSVWLSQGESKGRVPRGRDSWGRGGEGA